MRRLAISALLVLCGAAAAAMQNAPSGTPAGPGGTPPSNGAPAPSGRGLGSFGAPALGSRSPDGEDDSGGIPDSTSKVKVSAVPARTQVRPGDSIPVAVIFDIAKGWHIWTSKSAEDALPKSVARFDGAWHTEITGEAPTEGPALLTGFIQWPPTHDVKVGTQTYAALEGRSVAYVPMRVPADAAPGARALQLTASFQACDDKTCMAPGDAVMTIEVEVVEAAGATSTSSGPAVDAQLFAHFDQAVFARIDSGATPTSAARATTGATPGDDGIVRFDLFGRGFEVDPRGWGVATLLLVALLGGFLLNLTPCVLPIIPLKIMGLTQSSESRRRSALLGLAMSVGVVAFFLALAIPVALIKGLGINFLFTMPWVVLGVGLLICAMAVAMGGFFSFRLPDFLSAFEPKHETLKGSFFVGVFTGVLSTPCAGPFIASAAAYAALTVESKALLIGMFAVMGAGMAIPYLVLSTFPGLVKHVPRSGPSSDLVKHVMGVLLFAAGLFFICTAFAGFFRWRGYDYLWLVAITAAAAGVLLLVRTLQLTRKPINRLVFGGVGAAIVVLSIFGGIVFSSVNEKLEWTLYSPQGETAALAEGKVVVMKYTAHWCISCKGLEKTVLNSSAVVDRLGERDVALFTVDITDGDKEQQARLNKAGAITIPLLTVEAPDGTLVLRSDWYSPAQVIDAVNEAAKSRSVVKK